MDLTLVDFILLLPPLLGLVRGFIKGLIHEVVSLVAVILAIFLAFQYSGDVATWLSEYVPTDQEFVLTILAYIAIFGAVMIVAFLFSFILTKILQVMALGIINRILGAIFGSLKAVLVLMLLIHLFEPLITSSEEWSERFEKSTVYDYLNESREALLEWFDQSDLPSQIDEDALFIKDSLDPR